MKLPWMRGSRPAYTRITVEERAEIASLRAAGASVTEIARRLNRSRGAIYRAMDDQDWRDRQAKVRAQQAQEAELALRILERPEETLRLISVLTQAQKRS
jgi:IS30 family transposase